MELWGITGLMGAGKSTGLGLLKAQGFKVLDADAISRSVIDPSSSEGRQGLKKMVEAFGTEILDPVTGSLNRASLRKKISTNPVFRDLLEKVLHPLILASIKKFVLAWSKQGIKISFVEGTRLIESGFSSELKGIILVTAKEELRLSRVVARDGVTIAEAQQMMKIQNEVLMKKQSTYEWKNEGTRQELDLQIQNFLKERQILP